MPVALMLKIRPVAHERVPASLNRAAHAAVLRLIRQQDEALAEQVHADELVKPLTVSNVLGMERERSEYNRAQRDKTAIVTPEHTYDLRVTLLSSRLEELAQEWTPEHIGLLDLDGTDWQVEHVLCDEEADPWSGHASYETIAAPALLHAEQIPARWTLEFDSPVTFRQHGINQPFPLPWLVFGSLLDKWNAFAPLTLPEDIRRFASECIAVSRYNMRSQAEPTKQGALQIGSVGRCTYTATNRDRYWLACIETLAQFAFFSGIGAATTRGMGRARLVW